MYPLDNTAHKIFVTIPLFFTHLIEERCTGRMGTFTRRMTTKPHLLSSSDYEHFQGSKAAEQTDRQLINTRQVKNIHLLLESSGNLIPKLRSVRFSVYFWELLSSFP